MNNTSLSWKGMFLLTSLISLLLVGAVVLLNQSGASNITELVDSTLSALNAPKELAAATSSDEQVTDTDQKSYAQRAFERALKMHPDMSDLADAKLDESFLIVYEDSGQPPLYRKFLLRKDKQIVGFMDISIKTLETMRFGEFGAPLETYPDPPTADLAMAQAQEFLSQYGEDVTFDPPILLAVVEWWLIEVRRDEKVIASVMVSGDRVWEYHPINQLPTPVP